MADNVAITAGSGTSIATDDVGGAHYQKVKLYDPTADSSTALIGQKARSGSVPVVLSTEDAALIDGLETALALLLTEATFAARLGEVQASPTSNTVLDRLKTIATLLNGGLPALSSGRLPVELDSAALTALETINAAQSGTWTVQPGNTANTTPWLVKEQRPTTATTTSVNDTATSTTLLAANANRLGATIHNDSTAALYVKLGTTASATDFTVKMAADSYYEVPFGYTGRIDGIWASDASGAARITELTA